MAKSTSRKSKAPRTAASSSSRKTTATTKGKAKSKPGAAAARPGSGKSAAGKAPVRARGKSAARAEVRAKAPAKLAMKSRAEEPVYVPPAPLAPVPTDGKPRKNQAGLGVRDLEHFRELLLAKRRELVGDMSSMEREALRSASGTNLSNLPLHMADMGTDNYEQEFTLGLMEKDRNLLREINNALAKIQDGTYGICEGTGKPISKARLEAQPWARYSIEHARKLEQGRMR